MITNTTAAFMNDTSDSPFGVHPWYFTDQSDCTDPEYNFRTLNFHIRVESPGHFCCDDGICLESKKVCNGINDCSTDETQCDIVQIASTKYYPDKPPKSYGNQKKFLDVNVKTIVLDIMEINEERSYFYIYFDQKLKWYDENLEFLFLKSNPFENLINESAKIWKPHPEYCCFSYNEMPKKGVSKTYVSKADSPGLKLTNYDDLRFKERYTGENNPLFMEISLRAKFSCNFENYQNYPFGSEYCDFTTFLPGNQNNLTNLISESLEDHGRSSLGQYYIHWSVKKGDTVVNQHVGLTYTMHLSRNMESIILVTYLPTILMNIINQATNYISSEDK